MLSGYVYQMLMIGHVFMSWPPLLQRGVPCLSLCQCHYVRTLETLIQRSQRCVALFEAESNTGAAFACSYHGNVHQPGTITHTEMLPTP